MTYTRRVATLEQEHFCFHSRLQYGGVKVPNLAIKLQPLVQFKDLDTRGWLTNVTTFNFHPHLPHARLTATEANAIHVLAQQPVDMSHPHPFTLMGNRVFNM